MVILIYIFKYGGNSEFYGLNYDDQLTKIQDGLLKFKSKSITIRSFFAPNHIYDNNTLKALKECNIKIIIDGYGLFPFFKNDLLFVPQLFYREIILPFGIQSTQIHLNLWDKSYFENFENLIEKNLEKILTLDNILSLGKPNLFKDSINFTVEKFLKTLRVFK